MAADTAAGDTVQRNRRFVMRALVVCGAMFLFGFACVPMYRIVCEHMLKIRIYNTADSGKGFTVDTSRWVTVQFVGNVKSQLDWQFTPAWPRVAALACCAAIGFMIGITGLDRPFEGASTTVASRNDITSVVFEPEALTGARP